MMKTFNRLLRDESAQTAAEYAFLMVLILIIALVSIKLLGTNVNGQLDSIAKNLS